MPPLLPEKRQFMKIQLLAVGNEDSANFRGGIVDFTKRIRHYYPVEWKFIPASKNKPGTSEKEIKIKEADKILNSLKKEEFLIALDERGTRFNSETFSQWLQARANESIKQLTFLIGGAYGLDNSVLKRANFVWSLSPLTFPHQLVRLILLEQIYRACTIIRNEKYHHG